MEKVKCVTCGREDHPDGDMDRCDVCGDVVCLDCSINIEIDGGKKDRTYCQKCVKERKCYKPCECGCGRCATYYEDGACPSEIEGGPECRFGEGPCAFAEDFWEDDQSELCPRCGIHHFNPKDPRSYGWGGGGLLQICNFCEADRLGISYKELVRRVFNHFRVKCPKCGSDFIYPNDCKTYCTSRYDDKVKICKACGAAEAAQSFAEALARKKNV